MKTYIITLTALLVGLFAISHQQNPSSASSPDSEQYTPPPGSNQMLRAPITIADGLEAEADHSPRGGSEGARAIVVRVHVEGKEERILIGD